MSKELIHPELSYKITGLCFQVNNELGRFAREKQYADRLEQLLIINQIEYRREAKIPFQVCEDEISGNIPDFIITGKIILECEAKRFVTKDDYDQMQRYLKAANFKLGLIVNFKTNYLRPKRIINLDR